MIYDLTEKQKEEILKLFKQNPDLMFITRKVFNDETIDEIETGACRKKVFS